MTTDEAIARVAEVLMKFQDRVNANEPSRFAVMRILVEKGVCTSEEFVQTAERAVDIIAEAQTIAAAGGDDVVGRVTERIGKWIATGK